MIALLLSLLSFAGDAPADPEVTASVQALVAARHMETCTPVFAAGELAQVREALVAITEHESPPWAPMRAAGCLAELAVTDAVALSQTKALVAQVDNPGFALVVAQKLEAMPEPVAMDLGTAVWARSKSDTRLDRRVRPLVQASPHAAVRALVE